MKEIILFSIILFFSISFISGQEPQEKEIILINIGNQGGNMEGHTPRGFQGSGEGLFAGDNLNPDFPNEDGLQIFLSFDLSEIPEGELKSAILSSNNTNIEGNPFEDLGNLIVNEIRYEKFSSELWNLEEKENSCIFTNTNESSFECDITQIVNNSLNDDYKYAQVKISHEKISDEDNEPDLTKFFIKDSNTNEPRIFNLEVVIDVEPKVKEQFKKKNKTFDIEILGIITATILIVILTNLMKRIKFKKTKNN